MRAALWIALLAAPAALAACYAPSSLQFTSENGHINVNGAEFKLKGISWFGFETNNGVVHGLWANDYKAILDIVKNNGFNAIRLPVWLGLILNDATPNSITTYGHSSRPVPVSSHKEDHDSFDVNGCTAVVPALAALAAAALSLCACVAVLFVMWTQIFHVTLRDTVGRCQGALTSSRAAMEQADAVVFHSRDFEEREAPRTCWTTHLYMMLNGSVIMQIGYESMFNRMF
eukprot:m51a1_g9789 putative cellulase (glycosyl hydrolase family 5) subfamily protein (230) ;mRNA; r:1734257-1746799